jgi:large subunit ribosomal protein L32
MPVPKERKSRSRRNMRRSHDALATPARSTCPQCKEPKSPHRICANCGHYAGRTVLETDEE